MRCNGEGIKDELCTVLSTSAVMVKTVRAVVNLFSGSDQWWCLFVGNGATYRSPQMMGGLGGSTLPLLVCGSFPAAAGGCLLTEVVTTGRASHRPRTQRRRHTPASSETPPATPQCVRHDAVQESGWVDGVGKSMAAVVGFGTARKKKSFGIILCCLLMMKHRCGRA